MVFMMTWRIAPRIAWESEDELVFALSPLSEVPVALEGSGTLIWDILCEAPRTETEITETIADASGIAPEIIAPSIPGFLAHLAELQLVTSGD